MFFGNANGQILQKGTYVEAKTFYFSLQNIYDIENKSNGIHSPTFSIGYDISPQISVSGLFSTNNNDIKTYQGDIVYKIFKYLRALCGVYMRAEKPGMKMALYGVLPANQDSYLYLGADYDISSTSRISKKTNKNILTIPVGINTRVTNFLFTNIEASFSPNSSYTFFSVGVTLRYNSYEKIKN